MTDGVATAGQHLIDFFFLDNCWIDFCFDLIDPHLLQLAILDRR